MINLLQISDLHFGKPYVAEVGEAVLAAIKDMTPDMLIISGDFTQRAKRHEFEQARDFMQRLPQVPLVVTPGNHDVPLYRFWERLFQPYTLYKQYISEQLDTVTHHDNAVVVALNSTAPHRAISNGRITTEQLEFCEKALREVPDNALRIVVAHHHFAPAPDYEGSDVMPKSKRALDLFTRLKVDLILAGHLHRAYVGNSLDVYAGEDREHGIVIAQCGTTTSRRGRAREREKNSFNWIQITDASIRVLHYMYFNDSKAFSPVSQHEFARPSHGYLQQGITPTVITD